ncbi:S-4TM family putative pore-forming effector [Enterococcus cecorum]|uniref:S-4TM family putative pore-forming effector n=1 Tax=Enterococcus cecorum TaxID=44008 RepID=UPI002ACB02FD|nr:S-4TM family putative pore-forming effector [Enterococcus cecorum]MDZ5585148.1 S-4TM family putative pore-forming effector [Enterococcus cecorum]
MNNGIVERQNEETYIRYLAAQRQLYNEAKRLDGVEILFSVVIPLFFAALQLIISDNTYLNAASYVLSIVSMGISLLIGSYINRKKEMAAEIQQHFDLHVYQMTWDNKLFGLQRNVTHVVAEKAKLLLKNPKEHERLTNWYTTVAGTVDLKKGILMCQKENYNWDVNLRKRFRSLSVIVIIILTILVFLIGIVKNETVVMLLCRFAFIIPIFQWLFETVKQLNKDIKNLEELDGLISSSEPINMDKLQEIQSKIYIHRKSCYTIPNKFYDRYKNNDEDVAHRTALLDK